MHTTRIVVCLFTIIIFVLPGMLQCQDNLRTELFRDADQLSQQVKDKHADLYAPKAYAKAAEYYGDAQEAFRNGKKLEDIREKVKNSCAYFAQALDAAERAARLFNTVIIARDDAVSAGAPASQAELWKKAELLFDGETRALEGGDSAEAREKAPSIELAYRNAELEAITSNYLSPARILLRQAETDKAAEFAPATLSRARALVADVERLLKQNRRDAGQARTAAGEAKYEAAHAIALAKQIRSMHAADSLTEKRLLADEAQIVRIGSTAGVPVSFENGMELPVNNILNALRDKDAKLTAAGDSLRKLAEMAAAKDTELANLNEQIRSMQSRLGTLTENEKDLQKKITVQHDQETLVRNVAATFTPEEGSVLRDGDNIILRLYALTFASGKSDIEPQYYPLLTRVQDAIRKFGNCRVKIEGHTDSKGNERINQTLSESRAKAVAEYLMANMGVSMAIPSEGFGDTRPVASQSTPEGRARNRRIDVIITPDWAGK